VGGASRSRKNLRLVQEPVIYPGEKIKTFKACTGTWEILLLCTSFSFVFFIFFLPKYALKTQNKNKIK